MTDVFYEGRENFPANETELKMRLAAVEKLINNDENVSFVNINFVLAAGQLMQDCGLITENNLRFLSNAAACKNFNNNFRFPYNPGEGCFRRVDYDNDVMGYNSRGKENGQRFYHGEDRHLELRNGQHYLFSNDWYNDNNTTPNKRQFYNWLKINARMACKKFWERQPSPIPIGKVTTPITDDLKPDDEPATVTVDKPDDLSKIIESLNDLHSKVDNLTYTPNDLSKVIESLNDLHSKVDALTLELKELNQKVDELTEAVKMNGLHAKVDSLTLELDELKKIWE